MKDNPILKNMFDADQEARRSAPTDPSEFRSYWQKVANEDNKRLQKIKKLSAEDKICTGPDHYRAAMIFQHSTDPSDYERAQSHAESAMSMGAEEAKWLYAAATDRLLRSKGKKQKFGTQYEWVLLKEDDKYYDAMLMQPYDKRTTDKMRAEFNVPKLAELKKKEIKKRRDH